MEMRYKCRRDRQSCFWERSGGSNSSTVDHDFQGGGHEVLETGHGDTEGAGARQGHLDAGLAVGARRGGRLPCSLLSPRRGVISPSAFPGVGRETRLQAGWLVSTLCYSATRYNYLFVSLPD